VQHWLAVQVRSNTASELVQRRNSRTDFEASDGRNVVELNIKRISLERHAVGDANPTTFVMFDFFVHDTQTSELITGAHIRRAAVAAAGFEKIAANTACRSTRALRARSVEPTRPLRGSAVPRASFRRMIDRSIQWAWCGLRTDSRNAMALTTWHGAAFHCFGFANASGLTNPPNHLAPSSLLHRVRRLSSGLAGPVDCAREFVVKVDDFFLQYLHDEMLQLEVLLSGSLYAAHYTPSRPTVAP
jgi:hypothetical protein